MKNQLTIATVIIAILCLSSCGLAKTKYADLQYEARENDNEEPNFLSDAYLFEIADRFGLMAHFAQVAYRNDLLELATSYDNKGMLTKETIDKDLRDRACDYLKSATDHNTYGMPYSETGRWSRWKGNPKHASVPCYNQHGLFYETYVYTTNDGVLQEAVIAFRGTENTGSEIWYDWSTNLAATFGFEPDQYEIAKNNLPDMITALKHQSPNIKIYATGHSLGGGLAQQAGYLSRDVLEVFTFNTTPITNWSSLALDGKVANKYPVIHRLYNGGEALGGIRSITTLFTSARYHRHDIGIQVKSKELIAGHSMTLLSCHLACLISNRSTVAKHDFTSKFIKHELLTPNGLCKGYVESQECKLIVVAEND